MNQDLCSDWPVTTIYCSNFVFIMKLAVTLTSVMILYSLTLMAAYSVCSGICESKGKWCMCVRITELKNVTGNKYYYQAQINITWHKTH